MTVALYEYQTTDDEPQRVATYTDGEGWGDGGDRFADVEDYPRDMSEQFLMDIFDDIRLFAARYPDDTEPPAQYDVGVVENAG